MLNNAGDMDEDDMAQNQKKFRFTTETLIERYVLAVLVFEKFLLRGLFLYLIR